MTNWKTSIKELLTNLMPYAFTVNGNKCVLQPDEFEQALGYLNEQIYLLRKEAFKAGHSARNAEHPQPHETEVEPFLSDRAFDAWSNKHV